MKKILIIILFCVTVSAQDYKTYIDNKDKIDPIYIDNMIRDLSFNKQDTAFRIFTTTPTVSDLREGQIVLFVSDGAYRIYAKINNLLKYVNLQ